MGRNIESLKILKQRGTYRKDRHAKREQQAENAAEVIGNPPEHLNAEAVHYWHYGMAEMTALGIAPVRAHRGCLEIYALIRATLDQVDANRRSGLFTRLHLVSRDLGLASAEPARAPADDDGWDDF